MASSSYHVELIDEYDQDLLCSFMCEGDDSDLHVPGPKLLQALRKNGVLNDKEETRLSDREDPYEIMRGLTAILRRKDGEIFLKFLQVLQQRAQIDVEATNRSWKVLKTLVDAFKNKQLSDFNLNEEPRLTTLLKNLRRYTERRENLEDRFYGSPMEAHATISLQELDNFKMRAFTAEYTRINSHDRIFYSPQHGICISFSEEVFDILEAFDLHVGVLDPSLVVLPPNYVLCTPIVWVTTDPLYLQFPEDTVTVSFPHCATPKCESDLAIFALDDITHNWKDAEVIGSKPVDYCRIQFTISHFTSFGGGINIKRKRLHSESFSTILRKESDLPSAKRSQEDTDELESNVKTIEEATLNEDDKCGNLLNIKIICAMPINRMTSFPIVFYIHLDLPTYNLLTHSAITTMFENPALTIDDVDEYHSPGPIALTSNTVEFIVSNGSELNGWKLIPGVNPPKLCDIYKQLTSAGEASDLPRMLYKASSVGSTGCLECSIVVTVVGDVSSSIEFDITSTSQDSQLSSDSTSEEQTFLHLPIDRSIFESGSKLLKALEYQLSPHSSTEDIEMKITDINFKVDSKEHIRFFVCLAYNITPEKCERIAEELSMELADVRRIQAKSNNTSEQAFCILWDWVAQHVEGAKLSKIMCGLNFCNMTIKLTTRCSIYFRDVQSKLQGVADDLVDNDFIAKIYLAINKVWRFLGRLLGVSLDKITPQESEPHASLEMLLYWMNNFDEEATYKNFITALIIMHNLDPTHTTAAWNKLLKIL